MPNAIHEKIKALEPIIQACVADTSSDSHEGVPHRSLDKKTNFQKLIS